METLPGSFSLLIDDVSILAIVRNESYFFRSIALMQDSGLANIFLLDFKCAIGITVTNGFTFCHRRKSHCEMLYSTIRKHILHLAIRHILNYSS